MLSPPKPGLLRSFAAAISLLALPAAVRAEEPLRRTVDVEVRAGWEKAKITPAKPATESEFLRRVSLDLTGVIPSYEETVAFLDDALPADHPYGRVKATPAGPTSPEVWRSFQFRPASPSTNDRE